MKEIEEGDVGKVPEGLPDWRIPDPPLMDASAVAEWLKKKRVKDPSKYYLQLARYYCDLVLARRIIIPPSAFVDFREEEILDNVMETQHMLKDEPLKRKAVYYWLWSIVKYFNYAYYRQKSRPDYDIKNFEALLKHWKLPPDLDKKSFRIENYAKTDRGDESRGETTTENLDHVIKNMEVMILTTFDCNPLDVPLTNAVLKCSHILKDYESYRAWLQYYTHKVVLYCIKNVKMCG